MLFAGFCHGSVIRHLYVHELVLLKVKDEFSCINSSPPHLAKDQFFAEPFRRISDIVNKREFPVVSQFEFE